MAYVVDDPGRWWPPTGIPYDFDLSIPIGSAYQVTVEAGIAEWNARSPLPLVRKTADHTSWITFQMGESGSKHCQSAIGMTGTEQHIPCDLDWPIAEAALVHEIGHAAGLIHEHQRPDREEYVHVDMAAAAAQDKTDDHKVNPDGRVVGAYDCGSSMHYPDDPTLVVTIPGGCASTGSHALSAGDRQALSYMQGLRHVVLHEPGWSGGWTHLVPYSFLLGEPRLIAYNADSGLVHWDTVSDESPGYSIKAKGAWRHPLTHIIVLEQGLNRLLLRYDRNDGSVDIEVLRSSGVGSDPAPFSRRWSDQWTHVVAVGAGASLQADHVLVYDRSSGRVHMDRIAPGGSGTHNVWDGSWRSGWDQVVPYRVLGNSWHVLLYDWSTGEVELHSVAGEGAGASFTVRLQWGAGFTHVMPYPRAEFDTSGQIGFLAYALSTGSFQLYEVWGDGCRTNGSGRWDKWTHLVPTHLRPTKERGNKGMIAYNWASGATHIDRLL